MKSVLILGKPGCMKCENVKDQLFPLRELGYEVEYRYATPKEIEQMNLKTAPVVIIKNKIFNLERIEVGMTYDNVLRRLKL